ADGVVHGIATSGRHPEIDESLTALGVPPDTVVVDRGDVGRAKPEPDLFLTCAQRLRTEPADSYVVGDAVWDLLAARPAGMLSSRRARAALAGGMGGRPRLGGVQPARRAPQGLRPGDAALPERRAPHRPSEDLLGGGRHRPLPPAQRLPRPAPDGLRRVRAAG